MSGQSYTPSRAVDEAALKQIAYNSMTGEISGGFLSINAGDDTQIDITAGFAIVADKFTDPANPTFKTVAWSAKIGIDIDAVALGPVTFVAIDPDDPDGPIIQQEARFLVEEYRDMPILGDVIHPVGTILDTTDITRIADGYIGEDMAQAINNINLEGNIFSAASNDLTIRKESGKSFTPSGNRSNNAKDPHNPESILLNPATFTAAYANGIGGANFIPAQSDVQPNFWDDLSGTRAVVSPNKWTNKWCYFFPSVGPNGLCLIRDGEVEYNLLTDALDDLERKPTPAANLNDAFIRSVLTVKQGETDLSSGDTNFHRESRFGLL